ncbi:MAG: hypothetical protein U1E18_03095 [Brevundimonas sp.]|uniref:hypothetical protein n=1 Tax=Brevundimonas sp. TaxID=1871086 RepID=UPI002AB84FCD|nr:hypothetical protein [Brevundimonas sp.]MDZ4108567.1 hypothetical protein [Brevundimonas sp.]
MVTSATDAARVCTELAALCWIERHPGLAGWFQAVFSVLAIVVALVVPGLEARHQNRATQRRLHAAVQRASNNFEVVMAQLGKVAKVPSTGEGNRLCVFPMVTLEMCESELRLIHVNDLEDTLLALSVQHLLMDAVHHKELLLDIRARPDSCFNNGFGEIISEMVSRTSTNIERVRTRLGHSRSNPSDLLSERLRTRWKSLRLPALRKRG